MGQTNQTIHMIMPSKENLYNGRKGIGFENPRYFKKAKDLRPALYDEKVIGLGYTPMFLTYSDEALEIEKFKRSRENKIEFAYDYRNLNASYVNEKINLEDDYFQEIINPDFEKIGSPFQQTSSLKPYVSNVILEKIIIDLEDKVVSLLEKEKANLETIESLKSKGYESSENVSSESENQTKNDCLVVEKECDKEENPKKKKWSSNTLNVGLSAISVSNLNKNVKRYSRKDLLACNNSHLGETTSASVCNDAMNVSCNPRMNDLLNDNKFFIFDDVNVRISPVSKMPFRKKPRDSMHICLWIIDSGCSKHMTRNRALLTNFVEMFLGTVHFGNNDFAVIAGYGDVVIFSMKIKKFYYVEGLGHNLFSVGQFCDKGLEVAFRKSTCFVQNEDGVDLLTGDRSSNLYTIALNEVASNSSTCLLAKVSSSQSWLWHQRLSHLNFATINNLVKKILFKVISLGYTPMFLTHSDEALEIKKFKRSIENKIKFAYDYGNLNASYVNEKINFEDDYFQEIINPDFDKIDSPFQQTSSLKLYVPNVILENIIIDLEDEVVNLLENEKTNLETIESLKSKGFESSESAISESENQNEIDCHKIEKECDKEENPK
nr:integrase, catalytic region, zinc finger, CCHC-type, peptidase aspartic, catalytic [Tanacetum cinerariifolium]